MGGSAAAIREETRSDHAAVHAIHVAAFGQTEEADLVDALRAENAAILSLVAESGGSIAGHVLFTRMWIETPAEIPGWALGRRSSAGDWRYCVIAASGS